MSAGQQTAVTGKAPSVSRLGTNSAIYALANIGGRALNFLLVPLFTRVLTPSDYGILAIAGMISALLTAVLSASVEASVLQLHTRPAEAEERARLYGSLLVFWVFGSGALALTLHLAWSLGLLSAVIGKAFEPYFPIVLWSSFLNLFPLLPGAIFTVRQQAGRAAALILGPSVLTTALSVLLVAGLHQGVVGSFRATIVASAIAAAASVVVTFRMTALRFGWGALRRALRFSLPLVPHTAATWALSLSDRFILERYVPTSQIGLYLLGCQFGALTAIAGSSINNAFVPIVNAQLDDEGPRGHVPDLGTYAFTAIVGAGMIVAVFGRDAILLLSPPTYHAAAGIAPWIAGGFVLQGAYLILSRGSFYVLSTARIPVLTATAALVNVGLNIAFVPRFGIVAAAVNMVVSYAVLAALHAWLAHRLFPIPWQHGRMALVLAIAVGVTALTLLLPATAFGVSAKILVVLAFPWALLRTGAYSNEEWERCRAFLRRRLAGGVLLLRR